VRGCGGATLRDYRGSARLAKVAIWLEQEEAPLVEG